LRAADAESLRDQSGASRYRARDKSRSSGIAPTRDLLRQSSHDVSSSESINLVAGVTFGPPRGRMQLPRILETSVHGLSGLGAIAEKFTEQRRQIGSSRALNRLSFSLPLAGFNAIERASDRSIETLPLRWKRACAARLGFPSLGNSMRGNYANRAWNSIDTAEGIPARAEIVEIKGTFLLGSLARRVKPPFSVDLSIDSRRWPPSSIRRCAGARARFADPANQRVAE